MQPTRPGRIARNPGSVAPETHSALFSHRRDGALDFARVVDAVAEFLEREKARFALAGAFALHAYGMTRATTDVDFVTESSVHDRLVSFLESIGYETLYVSPGYSNHLHRDPAMGRVDVIYVDGATKEALFAGRGATLRFGKRELQVPRVEHLAAMKVHAMKNDPGRALQEMADIRFLMALPRVDHAEIRDCFLKAGLEDKYEEIRRSLPVS
jgi:nucleotidyltransferase AbiEii toxin of type IV toxin-antitoxin system